MSERILITGATGFLGTHLVDRLTATGRPLRALCTRERPELEERQIEVVVGSVTDEDAVRAAASGVSDIYHLAGLVSREPEDARRLYEIHVEGTRNLCRAAVKAGCRRMVLVSTSGTIAVSETPEPIKDEDYPAPVSLIGGWPYYTSKLYQEETARRECGDRLELVIVNPSLLLGPGDERLSSTEDVLRFLAHEIPAIPPGGLSFVDVRDAADTLVAAMEKAGDGERYLIGAVNWTFERFFERLERVSKVKGPRLRLPDEIYLWGGLALDKTYRHFGRVPPVDRVSMEMGRRFWFLDASKAERELGFKARDPYETLYETVSYIQKHVLGESVLERT